MCIKSVNLELLFDADEYRRSGECPWTFFAYPSHLAFNHGLPPDADACRLLATLQERGISVAIWINPITENTTYFACRHEDIQRLKDAIEELQRSGLFPEDFCSKRSERLFEQAEEMFKADVELTVKDVFEIAGRGTAVFFSRDPDPFWPWRPQVVRITTPSGGTLITSANVEIARKEPQGEVMGLMFPTLGPDSIPVGSKISRMGQTQPRDT